MMFDAEAFIAEVRLRGLYNTLEDGPYKKAFVMHSFKDLRQLRRFLDYNLPLPARYDWRTWMLGQELKRFKLSVYDLDTAAVIGAAGLSLDGELYGLEVRAGLDRETYSEVLTKRYSWKGK